MLRTAATFPDPDALSFRRTLLSEYNIAFGLSAYVHVDTLEAVINGWDPTRSAQLESDFFGQIQADFSMLRDKCAALDADVKSQLYSLRAAPEEEMKTTVGVDRIVRVYTAFDALRQYRAINLKAFRFVLEGFMLRCGTESLASQHKVRQFDSMIADSAIAQPELDGAEAMDYIASLYATVKGKRSFEEAVKELHSRMIGNRDTQSRILPLGDAFFFHPRSGHKAKQGRFGVKLIAGRTNPKLASRIEFLLQSHVVARSNIRAFANGEVSIRIDEAVRGDDVFFIQSIAPVQKGRKDATAAASVADDVSMSSAVIELLLAVQTMTLASAARCTVVVPYMAYTKQKSECAVLAELITLMGCHRVITVDMYKAQVEGFFSCPVENVTFRFEFIRYLCNQLKAENHPMTNLVVVSPDSEAVNQTRAFADSLSLHAGLRMPDQAVGVATAVKRLNSESIDIIGSVAGRHCFVVDSVIDEAVNICNVARKLKEEGAQTVVAVATHALFTGDAVARLLDAPLDRILVSDSIDHDSLLAIPEMAKRLRILPLAPLLAEAMDRIHTETTLSTLIDG